MSEALGYELNEHEVITEDGYVLKLFHHPGTDKRRKPVLLLHGIIDSAETFLVRGKTSLVGALIGAGYSVWSGNVRGSRYGRNHVSLNPDRDKMFWDFSFHEIGHYDLPALIDFVVNKTGHPQVCAIGHSLGNSVFYVLGSTRPEYNDKISVLIALSPVCFIHHVKPPISALALSGPWLSYIFELIGNEEVFGDHTKLKMLLRAIFESDIGYDFFTRGMISQITGSDPEELELDFFPTVLAHYPTGTSRKNLVHLYQGYLLMNFSYFDYGINNMKVYESAFPPKYDLSKVKMRIVLFAGKNDRLSTIPDVKLLYKILPNAEYFIVPHQKLNHVDTVWGRNMAKYLFPHIMKVLDKML
ncbi:lipase 1-like [Leptidea sinapis]|uniref:Partial AB-hydrolase lipase domain-containing protein n=1 Tax=Leptidea sinapis TaxID=189913 RepID=A0A5E4R2Q9_9NEOP|nr:lipase 1-like [Leptidea sinapis]VVD04801.1 unnamed protein product [Leptidea sinapis]